MARRKKTYKSVVYFGTSNVYEDMLPAIKSLLYHTQVDKIYLCIEDDEFPIFGERLPDICECINISHQTLFAPDSPNYVNLWAWVVLMRSVLTQLLPKEDKVLALDIDTIVNEDISALWDIDLTDKYFAAVKETTSGKSLPGYDYHNFGVVMYNLAMIREHGIDNEIVRLLNLRKWECPEQDCYNDLCQGHIVTLPGDYNWCHFNANYKEEGHKPIIRHYSSKDLNTWSVYPLVTQYNTISFDYIRRKWAKELPKGEKIWKPMPDDGDDD